MRDERDRGELVEPGWGDSMRRALVIGLLLSSLRLLLLPVPWVPPPPHEPGPYVSGHWWERDWYKPAGLALAKQPEPPGD